MNLLTNIHHGFPGILRKTQKVIFQGCYQISLMILHYIYKLFLNCSILFKIELAYVILYIHIYNEIHVLRIVNCESYFSI